jgi:hypothetical protein
MRTQPTPVPPLTRQRRFSVEYGAGVQATSQLFDSVDAARAWIRKNHAGSVLWIAKA